jgi:hypothetical protein
VCKIFKTISDELESIQADCDVCPQVIVMEHADEPEFEKHIKKRWTKGGEKLI